MSDKSYPAILKEYKLLDWPTLLIGWKNGFATRRDIIDYAVHQISNHRNEKSVIYLASCEAEDDDEVKKYIEQLIDRQKIPFPDIEAICLDRWRFAKLIALDHAELSDEEKIEELQNIYVQFEYPDDMSDCSIYSQNGLDPFLAMKNTISSLKQNLGI